MASNREEFEHIWNDIVHPVRETVLAECSPEFVKVTGLTYRGEDPLWLQKAEDTFHHWRHIFKTQCYGEKEKRTGNPRLDYRKLGAVLCQTFLVCKPLSFSLEKANALATEKKSTLSSLAYTIWAVNNTLINYKFAYLSSQQLVYLTLLADLLREGASDDMIWMGRKLNEVGHLYHYPSEIGNDTMDANIIVGLARSNVSARDFDMLLYAMLLFQHEMYTRAQLEHQLYIECKSQE